jgi:hypothetical protein
MFKRRDIEMEITCMNFMMTSSHTILGMEEKMVDE